MLARSLTHSLARSLSLLPVHFDWHITLRAAYILIRAALYILIRAVENWNSALENWTMDDECLWCHNLAIVKITLSELWGFFCCLFFGLCVCVEACLGRFAKGIFKLVLACGAVPVPCVLSALY